MLSKLLLAAVFQIGPFYQQGEDGSAALRPLWSSSHETVDVLWPVFTSHRDWWRFCFIAYNEKNDAGGQFTLFPFWWNGSSVRRVHGGKDEKVDYYGFFPFWGTHPHLLGLYDASFAMWPLYHSYSTPRAGKMMRTKALLFPFFHWRDDGSWGAWPFYVSNRARRSRHYTALWPFFTWAKYEGDRDSSGAGSSWMVWPFYGRVSREREEQHLILPPFFSIAKTKPQRIDGVKKDGLRVRLPWPFFDYEKTIQRTRLSIFPFYEKLESRRYSDGAVEDETTRFGWRLVEILPNETRVFPLWVKSADYFRLWPFWETKREGDVKKGRFLSLFPLRHVPAVDRNWAKFWTFYEREENPVSVDHSLFWGIIKWNTLKD